MIFDGHEGVRSWPNPFVIVVLKVRDNTSFISNKEHAVWEEEDNPEIKTSTPEKRDAFPELTDLICS